MRLTPMGQSIPGRRQDPWEGFRLIRSWTREVVRFLRLPEIAPAAVVVTVGAALFALSLVFG